jgi:hypothetical protein
MIKAGGDILSEALVTVFNAVLRDGCYPTLWQNNLILPIFKSGSKTDQNNYRGIAISSCLGKLFCMLINNRLDT